MNSFMVVLIQFSMIAMVWQYAFTSSNFAIKAPSSYAMTLARFMASMFTHIVVGQDVINGLEMMKYVINHRNNFTNPYAAFLFGYVMFQLSFVVEVSVLFIITGLPDPL